MVSLDLTSTRQFPSTRDNTVAAHRSLAPTRPHVEWITSAAALQELESDWKKLEEACPYPAYFQSFQWAQVWAAHLATDPLQELAVATARLDGELVATLPLALSREASGTYLVGLGEPVSQYDDVIMAETAPIDLVLNALWSAICQRPGVDGIQLKRVRETSPLARFEPLRKAIYSRDVAPLLDLTGFCGDPDSYMNGLKSTSRKNLKRYERCLAKKGKVGFEVYGAGPMAQELTRRALELKTAWLRENGMTSRMFMDDEVMAVLVDLAGDPASNLYACALTLDSKPIAIEIACLDHGSLGSFLGAYDPEFASCSPGQIQIAKTIEWATARGLDTYDLLPPDADYKRRIASDLMAVSSYAFPISLRGWLNLILWHGTVRLWLKSAFYKLPSWVRLRAVRALNA